MATLKKGLILTFSVLLIVTLSVFAFSVGTAPATTVETGVQYHARVLATHLDSSTGETTAVADGSNVLYATGKNMTRDLLFSTTGYAITNISLCNATAGCGAVTEAKAEAYNEITPCGLHSVIGDVKTGGTIDGNWSVGTVFTSTCDSVVVNVTRIENATGIDFAGRNLSTVNLDTNDQLTVNWTIYIT